MTLSLTTTYKGSAVGKYEEVKVSCPFIHLDGSSPSDRRAVKQAEAAGIQDTTWTQQGLQKHSELRIYHVFNGTIKTEMIKPQQTHTKNSTVFAYRESGTWICLKKGHQILLSSLLEFCILECQHLKYTVKFPLPFNFPVTSQPGNL